MTGLTLALGTLAVATMFGLGWRHRQGRIQRKRRAQLWQGTVQGEMALPGLVLGRLDSAAVVTLLALSTPMCTRCPQARALISELAAELPGVEHIEIDLTEHPTLAAELGVRSTPTMLAISPTGHELFRVAGMPRRAELLSALQSHL